MNVPFLYPSPSPLSRITHDDDDVELNVLGCRVDIIRAKRDPCVSMVQWCLRPQKPYKAH